MSWEDSMAIRENPAAGTPRPMPRRMDMDIPASSQDTQVSSQDTQVSGRDTRASNQGSRVSSLPLLSRLNRLSRRTEPHLGLSSRSSKRKNPVIPCRTISKKSAVGKGGIAEKRRPADCRPPLVCFGGRVILQAGAWALHGWRARPDLPALRSPLR